MAFTSIHLARIVHRVPVVALAALAGLLASASPALAQGGVGLRVGLGLDPDQFVVGAHAESGPLVESLTFRPSLDVGIGDGLTIVGMNAEFAYHLPVRWSAWRPYAGGGPALNLYRPRDGRPAQHAEAGFNGFFGVEHRQGLFAEAKLGALESPSLRVIVGVTFR
ncbi:MAG: hypothetical protein U0Q12_26140 [Vicinamibacterales bacterium]